MKASASDDNCRVETAPRVASIKAPLWVAPALAFLGFAGGAMAQDSGPGTTDTDFEAPTETAAVAHIRRGSPNRTRPVPDPVAAILFDLRGIGVLTRQDGWVQRAAFSPDGRWIVSASDDGTARIFTALSSSEGGATDGAARILRGHGDGVLSAAFSLDGAHIVTASRDGTARLWDAATGAERRVLTGHRDAVSSAAFSPDGTRVITASADGTARIWDAETGAALSILEAHGSAVETALFSPDGTRIVTAAQDHTARLWDADTGAEIAVLRGHEAPRCGAPRSHPTAPGSSPPRPTARRGCGMPPPAGRSRPCAAMTGAWRPRRSRPMAP